MTITGILVTIVATIAALAALTLLVLPGSARVARSAILPADPRRLFAILSTTSGFDSFNPFKAQDPTLQIAFSGPAEGVGAAFSWNGKSGKGSQTIASLEPESRVVMQLDLGPMGRPVQTFTLEPAQGGTRVTWAMENSFGLNPIGRVFGLFLDRMLGPTFELGLKRLADVARA